MTKNNKTSEVIDRFYVDNGKCCAGCDWWRYVNSVAGECIRNAPVSGESRFALLGCGSPSTLPMTGHIMTRRDHVCGDFKDEFDWSTLPAAYLKKIGKEQP